MLSSTVSAFIILSKPFLNFIAPSKDVGIISLHELRDIRSKTIKGEKADAIMISNDELNRIKNTMIIKSPE